MKDIFAEQFLALINPVWDLSPVHTMADSDLADFDQIQYLKISLSNNMYSNTSLTVLSIIMLRWVEASKNNLSVSNTPINKKKFYFLECLENLFYFVDQNKNASR